MSDLLEKLFSEETTQEEKVFSDVVEESMKGFSPNQVAQLRKTAQFKTERQRFLEIQRGTHEEHYVWHIMPFHSKKPWAVPQTKILYAIGSILHQHIPHDVLIDIFPPDIRWEIKQYTVKANGAVNHWALSESDFDKVTGQFFEILNTLI